MFPELEPAITPLDIDHRVTLVGYDRAAGALVGAARSGSTRQAYLIAGPPGVGKRTLARLLAQALACLDAPEARPCGRCRACRLVAAGRWPDVWLAEPPLRIESARALQSSLALAPQESAYRVAIVPEVELASPGAANSLLKTLEEPPEHVVLVLTTAQPDAALPTIRSRCHAITLRPLPAGVVADTLVARGLAGADHAALVARLSGGRMGWAIAAAGDAARLAARETWLDALAEALAADRAGRMAVAAGLAGDAAPDGLGVWSGWWRDVLLAQHGIDDPVVNVDRRAEIARAADRYAPHDIVATLRALDDGARRIGANTGSQLVLEVLCLALPT